MRWRRRRSDRTLKPVWSMFLFGLFLSIGFSPGSLIIDKAMESIGPYVTITAMLVLVILGYVIYDSIYRPLSELFKAFRAGGILATIALVFSLISGLTILFHLSGMIMLILAIVTWLIAVRYFR